MSDQPDQTEQLRSIAGQILSGDRLDSFVQYSRLDAFTNETGDIDTEMVMGHLTGLMAATQRNWGQGTGQPPGQLAGGNARAALAKRHGVKRPEHEAALDPPTPGAGRARAELAKRYGVQK